MFKIISNEHRGGQRYLEINPGKESKLPPEINQFQEIAQVSIKNCAVTDVTNLAMLKNLKDVYFQHCSFEHVPAGLTRLSHIRDLAFWQCEHLKAITGLELLENLENLSVIQCHELVSIHGFRGLSKLASLSFSDLYALHEITDVDRLINLESFDVRFMRFDFSTLNGLKNLKKIYFQGCPLNLHEIKDLILKGGLLLETEGFSSWRQVIPIIDLEAAKISVFVDNDYQFFDAVDSKKASQLVYEYFLKNKRT